MINHINTVQEFKDFIKNGVVLVDFYASWCGPCRMLAPIIEELDEEYEGKIKILKVDVDELSDLAGEYQIYSIPTILIFKDGKMEKKQVGFLPKNSLDKIISQVLN